jgi:AraC-like DNA-binding protein
MQVPTSGTMPPSDWSPSERVVMQLAQLLAEAGGDVRTILKGVGVTRPSGDAAGGWLSGMSQEKLHEVRDVLMRHLAYLLADRASRQLIRNPDWQMLFFCLTNCRTLREAIERACDLITVMDGRCGRMYLHAGPSKTEVQIDSLWPEHTAHSFAVDVLSLASFIDIFSWLISQPLPVTCVVLDYPPEVMSRFDPGVLAKPIVMNAGRSGFVFPSAYLDYPVTRTTEDCEAGMSRIPGSMFDPSSELTRQRLVERTRRVMYRALRDRGGLPSVEELCNQFGCSRSQLRRWLASEGISYNAIKESCRRELALDLLRRTRLSIEDISTRLDFSDADAFRKAFRQWTRLSPTEYRRDGTPVG